jgi:hypothetical protein
MKSPKELTNEFWNKITANIPPALKPLVIPVYTETMLIFGSIAILIFNFSWTTLAIALILQAIMIFCIIRIFTKITGEKLTWK